MFTRLSSTEILDGVVHHIENTLMPELRSEPAIVTAQMVNDLVGEVQRLIAHEPQWLSEETATMLSLLDRSRATLRGLSTGESEEALQAIDQVDSAAAPTQHEAVGLGYLQGRYSDVGLALEKVIRALGLTEDEGAVEPLVKEIQRYLHLRSDREIVIAGNQPFRGRG